MNEWPSGASATSALTATRMFTRTLAMGRIRIANIANVAVLRAVCSQISVWPSLSLSASVNVERLFRIVEQCLTTAALQVFRKQSFDCLQSNIAPISVRPNKSHSSHMFEHFTIVHPTLAAAVSPSVDRTNSSGASAWQGRSVIPTLAPLNTRSPLTALAPQTPQSTHSTSGSKVSRTPSTHSSFADHDKHS